MAFVLKTSEEGTQGRLMDEAKGGGLHCQRPDDTLSIILHINYLDARVIYWPPKQELKRTMIIPFVHRSGSCLGSGQQFLLLLVLCCFQSLTCV